MNPINPYSPPESDPTQPSSSPGELQLATLSERFTGVFMDGLVSIAIIAVIWGVFFFFGIIRTFAEISKADHRLNILVSLIFLVIYSAIQWKFLNATGQTIGKKVAGTRIVSMDGLKPGMRDLFLKRYVIMFIVNLIPGINIFLGLVDSLMVFRKDRRCLHDLIAGTQVIKVYPGEIIS